MIKFIGQKVFECGEQKRPELPFLAVDVGERLVEQQPGEELLSQILGCMRRMSTPPDVGIEGIPVPLAKLSKSQVGRRRTGTRRRQHHRPLGCAKTGRPVLGSGDFAGGAHGTIIPESGPCRALGREHPQRWPLRGGE